MKVSVLLTALAMAPTPLIAAAVIAPAPAPAPEPIAHAAHAAHALSPAPAPAHHRIVTTVVEPRVDSNSISDPHSQHWKRKGGGGSRGGSKGGGSKSGGSKSGGSKSSSKSKSKPSRTTSSSNSGGRTSAGTGPARAFGNGKYYAGGSSVPFTSGSRSPSANIAPALIGGAAAGLVFGALLTSRGASASQSTDDSWYFYHWPEPYNFFNATTQRNESDEVVCGCRTYAVCGCDYTDDTSYMASIIGDGRYETLNKSLVSVADYEGSRTIFVDGTLPNGTTAPGGTDDAGVALAPLKGYWPVMVLAGAMAIML
jgi:hypothetical protein